MRFPLGLLLMTRLRRLFERDDIAPNIALIPYIRTSQNNMHYLHYNGVRTRKNGIPNVPPDDHFGFGIAEAYRTAGYESIVNDVQRAHVAALQADPQNGEGPGWNFLMEQDRYSTRAYMSVGYWPDAVLGLPVLNDANGVPAPGLPNDVINWCETMDGSTGGYDRAFSQKILGAMAFGATDPPPVPNWMCIE